MIIINADRPEFFDWYFLSEAFHMTPRHPINEDDE